MSGTYCPWWLGDQGDYDPQLEARVLAEAERLAALDNTRSERNQA
ncbi:hypothetical protein GCM10009785_01260 [Brooklawnia cerclae]|uniref:Uncharacterized protein n=1 Tax=Brooklawnia cerclae TaxID=349934 RepID=A0ABX0SE96_9ACTN|nr:hypothetical protein [Brooklawnia cerclae]NIH56281.1 hypothetical protein [Brooklawnia cerclae]